MWRWTGFNMGLDLIVNYDNFGLSLKRNQHGSSANEHEALLSNHKKRHVYYKVAVASLNEQKQTIYSKVSEIKHVVLGKNTVHPVLRLDPDKCNFPLLLSFNFVVSNPVLLKDPDETEEDITEDGDDDDDGDIIPVEGVEVQQ